MSFMKNFIYAAAFLSVGLLSSLAMAQNSAPIAGNGIEIKPYYEMSDWRLSSVVRAAAVNQKLLCTLSNKDETAYLLTLSWNGRNLLLTVAQRIPTAVDQMVQISLQGKPLKTEGGTMTSLQTITGLTLVGSHPLDLLRKQTSLDIQIGSDQKPMSIPLPHIDEALDRLQACLGDKSS